MTDKLVVFKGKEIRRVLHNDEWWFAIVDIVAGLTDSVNPAGYVKDLRRRDNELSKGWGQIATPLLDPNFWRKTESALSGKGRVFIGLGW